MSTVRCGVEKSIPITNETVSAEHINLSVGSACHNALCPTNDAARAHMATVRGLHTSCFIQLFVSAMPEFELNDVNDNGKRFCISK